LNVFGSAIYDILLLTTFRSIIAVTVDPESSNIQYVNVAVKTSVSKWHKDALTYGLQCHWTLVAKVNMFCTS